jgi:hypothetical protein
MTTLQKFIDTLTSPAVLLRNSNPRPAIEQPVSEPPSATRVAAVLLWTVAAGWGLPAPWLMWWVLARDRLPGAALQFGLLPVEAVLWFGFALPFPPLFALIRIALTLNAWRRLT